MSHHPCVICGDPIPERRSGVTCHPMCAIALRQQRAAAPGSRTAAELIHASHHHRVYGLTCEAFDALLSRADYRCEICRAEPKAIGRRRPASGLLIDHDHQTGAVQHMRRIDDGSWAMTEKFAAYLSAEVAA